jgi:D-serine deaminase-like pyridoxal phosphate-dependent protein
MYNPDPMNWFDSIISPTLILNKERCLKNIRQMAEKAKEANACFRPHFKTHQSAIVGEWFRPFGVSAITVSSVSMAKYFSKNGWKDITIAFPVNIREIHAINDLAKSIHLELLAESVDSIRFLGENLKAQVGIWLKADVGANRTGIPVDDHHSFLSLAREINSIKKSDFKGILTHAGQTYHSDSVEGVKQIYRDATAKLQSLRESLHRAGFKEVKISWGDTPSCSLVEDLRGVNEIRPGNFVLYDYSQLHIGSGQEDNIAAAVACPVVAIHPDREEIVIHGGAIHLSKESLERNNMCTYGQVALPATTGWGKLLPGGYVKSLSQEHGILSLPKKNLADIHIGDLVVIVPIHSCLTVNLFKRFITLDGEIIPTMQMEPP